jgi:hypothetical protein
MAAEAPLCKAGGGQFPRDCVLATPRRIFVQIGCRKKLCGFSEIPQCLRASLRVFREKSVIWGNPSEGFRKPAVFNRSAFSKAFRFEECRHEQKTAHATT